MKKLKMRHYGVLAIAFLLGLALAFCSAKTIAAPVVVTYPQGAVRAVGQYPVMVVRTPRIVTVPRTIVARPTYLPAPIVVEQRPASPVAIVETPRTPFVRRGALGLGILPDRVITPRRSDLTVVPQ